MPLPSKSERVPYPILKKKLTKIHFPVYEDHDDVANDKYARVIMVFIKSCKKLMNDKNEMEQKRKLIRETLTDTSYEVSEAKNDMFKVLMKEQPVFTIGLKDYGSACGLPKLIKSGTAALTKLAELVEEELEGFYKAATAKLTQSDKLGLLLNAAARGTAK